MAFNDSFLKQAMKPIQDGNYNTAIFKLNEAIERTDGCVLRGSPDTRGSGRDWITDCAAQENMYNQLTSALNALLS